MPVLGSSSGALAPFRIRSYRFQWSADLLTSWAFEMETLVLGWYVMVNTGSVLLLTAFGARHAVRDARDLRHPRRPPGGAGAGRAADAGLGARRDGARGHRASERPRDAQLAHRRDDPARSPDGRAGHVA